MLKSIRKINTLRGLKKNFTNLYILFLKLKRKKQIKNYINTHSISKLHLSSNKTLIDGWICSDFLLLYDKRLLSLKRKFLHKDKTPYYILCEKLIVNKTENPYPNLTKY